MMISFERMDAGHWIGEHRDRDRIGGYRDRNIVVIADTLGQCYIDLMAAMDKAGISLTGKLPASPLNQAGDVISMSRPGGCEIMPTGNRSFMGDQKNLPKTQCDIVNGIYDCRRTYLDPNLGITHRMIGYSGEVVLVPVDEVVLVPVEIWEKVVALVKKHLPGELDPQNYTNPTDGME